VLVAEIVVHRGFDRVSGVGRCLERVGDLVVLGGLHPVAPEGVDGAAFGEGHQPGAGFGGNAGLRPFGEGRGQRVLRQLLGEVDIAGQAGEARDEPRPFNAEGRLDCAMDFGSGHTAFSAKGGGETSRAQPLAGFCASQLSMHPSQYTKALAPMVQLTSPEKGSQKP